MKHSLEEYRNGGDGLILWCEDNVRVKVYREGSDIAEWCPMGDLPDTKHPDTDRSYVDMWENQKKVLREALVMHEGRFVHRLIVFCWPRGEGKSYVVCLIQLWKFFCWPSQQIMLGANSKDQVKFVHYDIMRDLILNSPNLLKIVGEKNVQEKEIRLKSKGKVLSIIRSISSFSGIVSNITGYTFSEIFDMKKPRFFTQLDGSIRNMPNALGVIDSTVSEKDHVLYKLYMSYTKGEDPSLYFSFRCSQKPSYKDFWHPHMTQAQLNSYKSKFPVSEFDRYFKNTWEAGVTQVFTDDIVESIGYIGIDGVFGGGEAVRNAIKHKIKHEKSKETKLQNNNYDIAVNTAEIDKVNNRLIPVDNVYKLQDSFGHPSYAPVADLHELGRIFKTDWAILAGVDRSDPLKNTKRGARTIVTVVAKGLPNSKNNMDLFSSEGVAHKYIYFLLHLVHVETGNLEHIKEVLRECVVEYDGIDTMCAERWGMWDIVQWCEEQNIAFEPITSTYAVQRAMFTELYTTCRTGRFKAPKVYVEGTKTMDILREEMSKFDHNPDKKWYGSPEKNDYYGVQDDVMYSLGCAMYSGRDLNYTEFRERQGVLNFGEFYEDYSMMGRY